MQRTDFGAMACSIARTWSIVGEPWSPLIIRDVFLGIRRFDELQRDLGLSRKVLAQRLAALIGAGILERQRYQDGPPRDEYVLTSRGEELVPVLLSIMAWGDRWLAGDGPPAIVRHRGHDAVAEVTCAKCGEPLRAGDFDVRPGPGGQTAPGTQLVGSRLAR